MGDPICKWRNASVPTIVELVEALPKKKMPKEDFRQHMLSSVWGKAFLRTAYQLACQVGLYYIDENDTYIPRFNHNISEDEAFAYLHKWIKRYYVPNPYTTKKFETMDHPIKLLYAIVDHVREYPHLATLENACDSIFGETTGNLLCVKFILNSYANIIEIDKDNNINLLVDVSEDYAVWHNRDDKKAFFETFNE